ncbi:MAG: GyrI-like domain-containing protein [Candidatus Verstraetearchaeota archaeon]|nr:GyrI-like domain-containing protein [Candidatus Verstraetearchaeota archaeon]
METEFRVVELEPQPALAISEEVLFQEIGKKIGELFIELANFLQSKGGMMTGPPFSFYHSWDDQKVVVEVGFPTAALVEGEGEEEGRLKPIALPGGKAVTGIHVGPYDRIGETYKRMMDWMAERKLRSKGMMWESYLTDPEKEGDPSKYMTQIFFPVEG